MKGNQTLQSIVRTSELRVKKESSWSKLTYLNIIPVSQCVCIQHNSFARPREIIRMTGVRPSMLKTFI